MTFLRPACIAFALLTGACVAKEHRATGVQYQAPVVNVEVGTEASFTAAQSVLREQGFEIALIDREAGLIRATSRPDRRLGFETREVWTVVTKKGEIRLTKDLQERLSGEWVGYDIVDPSYAYSAERQILGDIARRATNASGQIAVSDDSAPTQRRSSVANPGSTSGLR